MFNTWQSTPLNQKQTYQIKICLPTKVRGKIPPLTIPNPDGIPLSVPSSDIWYQVEDLWSVMTTVTHKLNIFDYNETADYPVSWESKVFFICTFGYV